MHMLPAKVHFQIFKHFIDHCELLKLDRNDLFKAIGVDESFLENNFSYICVDLLEKVVTYAYEKLGENITFLDMYNSSSGLSVGPLELLMTLSRNIDEAIMVFYKYREINGDLQKNVTISITEDEVILKWEGAKKNNLLMRCGTECQTAWWGALIKLVETDHNNFMKRVCYEHELESFAAQEKYNNFFGCPVFFNQKETILSFSKSALSAPLRTVNKDLYLVIENYIKSVLTVQQKEEAVKDKVKMLILLKLQKGKVSRELIAKRMGITVKTLTRKLNAEDSSYGKILDEVRVEAAKRYLETSSKRIVDISRALGFSTSSAFITWFKMAFGGTPKQYRDSFKKT